MKSTPKYSLFSLAFPITVEFLFQRLFGIADTLVLGNYADNAVAAVGYADQILSISLLIFQVVSSGTSILLAQAIGGKNKESQRYFCSASLLLSLMLGAITCITIIMFRTPLLNLLNVTSKLQTYASDYLLVMAFSQFFSAIFFSLTAIYRSFGNAYYSSTISIISNILNVIGDLLVVKGIIRILNPVQDVALVTVFSKALSCICAFILLWFKSKDMISLSFPTNTFKSILQLGIPAAGESCSYKFSQLIGTAIIGSLGADILTGKIYGMTFSSVMVLIPDSIAIATGILVGVNAGEGNWNEANRTVVSSIKKGALAIIIVDIPLLLLGRYIINTFYTDNPLIQNTAYFVLCAEAITMFIKNINLNLGNSLRAIKDVNYPVIISIISMWSIGTGLCWLLGIPLGYGITGIFISFFLDETIRAYLLFKRWRRKTSNY